MPKIYSFYLPQYHPIPENDEWYGKGFTEWRSVAAAKPLYPGHYQPHIPADLGFYDLRLKKTLLEQVKLANEYGVDGFCFWHYWFGEGKQLLETPFNMLVNDKSIDIQFAAAWGNASWYKKQWGADGQDKLLVEQKYLGEEDYVSHFYSLLNAFKDERYIRIDNKPIFIIYMPLESSEIYEMMKVWRKLAKKEGLEDMYFIAHDLISKSQEKIFEVGYDGIYNDNMLNIHHRMNNIFKSALLFLRQVCKIPTVFEYKNAIKYMITDDEKQDNIFPTVVPNWDHTPRTGCKNIMFKNCDPKYFGKLLENAFEVIKNKEDSKQIIFVKSWNEWGEGNHLEPDLKYGKGYLEEIKKIKLQYRK